MTYKEKCEKWIEEEKAKGLVDYHITHKLMFEDCDKSNIDKELIYKSLYEMMTAKNRKLIAEI